MEKLNLLKDNEKRVFFHYLIPSIFSTLVNSIYILVDTLIIGQGVGADGISALNIFLPFFSIYNAIGLMFGLGGGILISVEDGMGNKEKSDKFFIASLMSVAIVGIVFTLFSNIFLKQICIFLGANDYTMDLVIKYGRCISLFTPSFIATNFLLPIVRNKKSPKLAMMSVLIGAGINIILDYIFVFHMNMGMIGAALATVIGSLSTVVVLLTYFIPKKNRIKLSYKGISFRMIKRIINCGTSTFLMEVATGFVIFIFNIQILKYIGDTGIVVYGIISNCIIVGNALFNGVAQASQPILATNYGAKQLERVSKILKYAMITTIIIGSILFATVFVFTQNVIYLFVKATNEIITMGIPAVRLYLSAFCVMNINILLCNYFQTVGKEKISIYISAIRGFILNIVLALSLPIIFGGMSLWIVVPLTEIITFVGTIFYIYKIKARNTSRNIEFNKLYIS